MRYTKERAVVWGVNCGFVEVFKQVLTVIVIWYFSYDTYYFFSVVGVVS